jgi:hypothetical protein
VAKAGEKGVLNLAKWVPLVGGPIDATVEVISCKTIATYALRTFEAPRPNPAPPEAPPETPPETPSVAEQRNDQSSASQE